jgi:ABC-type cobalt transport system substrate-binding protein
MIDELRLGDKYFIRFFNQTILNQCILFGLVIWSAVYYFMNPKISWGYLIIIDSILLFIQWNLLSKYRKRMMDLEMDYNIIVPGKIIFVNQSGMLSSSQAVEGEKVKTVMAKYPSWIASFFHFGNIEVMTEGDQSSIGTTNMYYVPRPTETAHLIQSLLEKEVRPKENPEVEKKSE